MIDRRFLQYKESERKSCGCIPMWYRDDPERNIVVIATCGVHN